MAETTPARPIRSFVLREGRLTDGQRRALERLWPRYGIAADTSPLDPTALFGRTAPLFLEIGFGDGANLAALARARPEHDFLGIEVHRPGIGRLLAALDAQQSTNARVIRQDAMEVLRERLPFGALAGLYLLFPDPWPKKRHHKRRIVTPEFVALAARAIAPGGLLHLATDWQEYADAMAAVVAGEPAFGPLPADADDLLGRIETRFERRGLRLGHRVCDLRYRRL